MHNQRMGTSTVDLKGKQAIQESRLQEQMYNPSTYSSMSYIQPSQFAQMPPTLMAEQNQQNMFSQQEMQYSETDFEAAFQDALQHAEQEELHIESEKLGRPEADTTKQLPIGSDAINYIEQADRTHDQDSKDADELARTAGQLLNIVQHDTSDKMKNSQFLDLMRRIRDREVEVQNNDIQSTSNQAGYTPVEESANFYHEIPQAKSVANTSQTIQNSSADTSTESARESDPFSFPDMNAVYAYDAQTESMQTPPAIMDYSSHDDEYPNPQSQIQALHPGGPYYPEQKSPEPARAEMRDVENVMSGGRQA